MYNQGNAIFTFFSLLLLIMLEVFYGFATVCFYLHKTQTHNPVSSWCSSYTVYQTHNFFCVGCEMLPLCFSSECVHVSVLVHPQCGVLSALSGCFTDSQETNREISHQRIAAQVNH